MRNLAILGDIRQYQKSLKYMALSGDIRRQWAILDDIRRYWAILSDINQYRLYYLHRYSRSRLLTHNIITIAEA